MNTSEIADVLKLTAQLMELHGENPFKVKSLAASAFRLGKSNLSLEGLSEEELTEIEGIGKGIASKIHELQTTGKLRELSELLSSTPGGVTEMLSVNGIGPKKARVIWKELGIESVHELLYACNENRLLLLKGFGAKTQEQVRKSILFSFSNKGKFRYAEAEEAAQELLEKIKSAAGVETASFTGKIRRKCEVLEKIELLAAVPGHVSWEKLLMSFPVLKKTLEISPGQVSFSTHGGIPVTISICQPEDFSGQLLLTTGSKEHIEKFHIHIPDKKPHSEEEIYRLNHLPFIEPEMREGMDEISWAQKHPASALIEMHDLKGILHNHTTYSDGINSLSEMAAFCKELGYGYLGICDHSRSAVYANGLSEERIREQHKEIELLNKTLAPFRIFKGIESDILSDGSLDYEDSILSTFDFVVASIHSNLKMSEEKATERLLKAIENPFTTILGHPTGRLLLAREGYPISHKKVIDACAEYGVVIELNANPYRLDIDWRWIPYALSKNVMISINPDAHVKEGFYDLHYGVCAARKGGLTKESCFNALQAEKISDHFSGRKILQKK